MASSWLNYGVIQFGGSNYYNTKTKCYYWTYFNAKNLSWRTGSINSFQQNFINLKSLPVSSNINYKGIILRAQSYLISKIKNYHLLRFSESLIKNTLSQTNVDLNYGCTYPLYKFNDKQTLRDWLKKSLNQYFVGYQIWYSKRDTYARLYSNKSFWYSLHWYNNYQNRQLFNLF